MTKRALILAAATVFSLGLSSAQAQEIVTSESVMKIQSSLYQKDNLIQLVSREDMQTQLVKYGVTQELAIARINAMTDAELATLNQQLEEGKAGGLVGVVLTVLAFLAITDLLGVTDVYPFINPINN